MKDIKNLKEFKALILRYESITIEEIEDTINNPKYIELARDDIKEILTGFGSYVSCSLCKPIMPKFKGSPTCCGCTYVVTTSNNCTTGINTETYIDIQVSKSPKKIKAAFKARAKHMRNLLKTIENE